MKKRKQKKIQNCNETKIKLIVLLINSAWSSENEFRCGSAIYVTLTEFSVFSKSIGLVLFY